MHIWIIKLVYKDYFGAILRNCNTMKLRKKYHCCSYFYSVFTLRGEMKGKDLQLTAFLMLSLHTIQSVFYQFELLRSGDDRWLSCSEAKNRLSHFFICLHILDTCCDVILLKLFVIFANIAHMVKTCLIHDNKRIMIS